MSVDGATGISEEMTDFVGLTWRRMFQQVALAYEIKASAPVVNGFTDVSDFTENFA